MGEEGLAFAPKAAVAATVMLGACSSDHVAQVPLPDTYAVPDVPAAPSRLYSSVTTNPDVGTDRCGAGGMAWLVGRPRTEIPVGADLSNRWVRAETADAPPGVAPQRLNIIYDPATGVVTHVQCG